MLWSNHSLLKKSTPGLVTPGTLYSTDTDPLLSWAGGETA